MSVRPRAATSGAHTTSRVLLFAAGNLPLGVPLEDMLRVIPEEEVLPMPLAHAALHGVMPTTEGISPVYDLGVLFHGPMARALAMTSRTGDPLVALFPHAAGSVGVRVDRLQGLAPNVTPLTASMQKNLQLALPAAAQALCTGAATSRGQLFFFFSKDAFLAWLAQQVPQAARK